MLQFTMAAHAKRSVDVVAVLLPLEYGFFRDILSGIMAYQRPEGRWQVLLGTPLEAPQAYQQVVGDRLGVITTFRSDEMQRVALDLGVPVVNVSGSCTEAIVPRVLPDNVAIGRIAAEHLLDRGFRRFMFGYAPGSWAYGEQRLAGFRQGLGEHGFDCRLIERREPVGTICEPVGMLASDDRVALDIQEQAFGEAIPIPEMLAVVGVNNDEALCLAGHPPITSIDPAARKIGFQAADMLARLVRGERLESDDVRVPPAGLVARGSTDSEGIADMEVARALRFIRDHATEGLLVPEVASAAGLCRRTLERRFRNLLGRSIHDSIREARLQAARTLLIETDLKIWDVSNRCGFSDFRRFSQAFRHRFGLPPGRFRAQISLR